jgi:hypothetical protein
LGGIFSRSPLSATVAKWRAVVENQMLGVGQQWRWHLWVRPALGAVAAVGVGVLVSLVAYFQLGGAVATVGQGGWPSLAIVGVVGLISLSVVGAVAFILDWVEKARSDYCRQLIWRIAKPVIEG